MERCRKRLRSNGGVVVDALLSVAAAASPGAAPPVAVGVPFVFAQPAPDAVVPPGPAKKRKRKREAMPPEYVKPLGKVGAGLHPHWRESFPDDEEEFQRQMRYQSSHKTQFLDWKPPRHVMIRRRTNDPSENDHPMVGRHDDPGRLELQAAMGPPVSTAAAAYANPGRGSYQPLRCAPRPLRTARARARRPRRDARCRSV